MSAFALTYRKQIIGELGLLRVEGYEYWETFRIQSIIRFALTHVGERTLTAMEKMKHTGNID